MTGQDLQIHLDVAVLRLTGAVPLAEAAGRVTEAILFARERQVGKLLVDTLRLARGEKPTAVASYFRIQEWARAADGLVRVAMVLPDFTGDPRGVGLTMAANSGLIGAVFTDEAAALAWLNGAPASDGPDRP
jgi:hypothetical protein